jgi:hypothetical protein
VGGRKSTEREREREREMGGWILQATRRRVEEV